MDDKNREYQDALADIITAKPHEFTVGRKHLRLYPVTLAKMHMVRPYMDALEINQKLFSLNPHYEVLRAVSKHRKEVCSALSIHTSPNSYRELFNAQAFSTRRNLLDKASDEDLATLLLVVLSSDKTEQVIGYLGLDKESERKVKIMRIKGKSKNSIQFGGLSVFGSFIGQLKEMGYTDDEILYERPYAFLRLVLADKTLSVYLTDEELQNISVDDGGNMIDGNEAGSFDKLKSVLAGKHIKLNE